MQNSQSGALRMITISKEDYLKAVLEAESEGEHVISATLAHRLAVSAPAVTMALRRLKRDGLVAVRADGHVELTAAGRKVALRTMVRHHLIERMLAEVFGMEWYRVHDEAERLEHAVSAEFEAKLAEKLGPAGTCPHGNPVVPERGEARRRRGLRLLSEAEPGRNYQVNSVYERDSGLLRFLDERGIRPGAKLQVLERNYDQTMTLSTDERKVSLGGPAADKVWVAPAGPGKVRKR
jgi:DtxR family transcriptional regulator, Mn-dependent transcriptional regulator